VTTAQTRIRDVLPTDAGAVAAIYNHYVLHSSITFEEQPVATDDIGGRIAETTKAAQPWLVAERGEHVLGYAYATRWRGRSAYRFSAESTVYLEPRATGQGLGTRLLEQLLARLCDASVHAVIAGVALPNPASVALHERLGFRRVATFAEVGFKFGRWIDVAYWQTLLPTAPGRGGRAAGSA
jgi:L-amino acid N-acyltransferase YncA